MTKHGNSYAHEVLLEAFEQLPLGAIIVHNDGVIFAVNAELERLLGYARTELIGQPVEILIPPTALSGHHAARTKYTQEATTRPMGHGRELSARHRDGRAVPVEIGLSPISVRGENLVVCTIVDVTERRKLETQLVQTQKMEAIGNLAAGIAHDFKNLLLAILGNAEVARELPGVSPEVLESLDVIVETSFRARDLVGRILAFARKGDIPRQPLHWEPIVRATIKLFRVSVPPTIAIQLTVDSNTPCVSATSPDLQQIFMNLFTNAVHAMARTPGSIDVRLSHVEIEHDFGTARATLRPAPYACLSVSDQGPGIAPELVERIFEPFFTTKTTEEGSGLGLSVVRRLVENLGGAVVVSDAGAPGARFDVYLPAAHSNPLCEA